MLMLLCTHTVIVLQTRGYKQYTSRVPCLVRHEGNYALVVYLSVILTITSVYVFAGAQAQGQEAQPLGQ
jgi:hypothetical protein